MSSANHELAEEDIKFGLPFWIGFRAEVLAEKLEGTSVWLFDKFEQRVELADVVQNRCLYSTSQQKVHSHLVMPTYSADPPAMAPTERTAGNARQTFMIFNRLSLVEDDSVPLDSVQRAFLLLIELAPPRILRFSSCELRRYLGFRVTANHFLVSGKDNVTLAQFLELLIRLDLCGRVIFFHSADTVLILLVCPDVLLDLPAPLRHKGWRGHDECCTSLRLLQRLAVDDVRQHHDRFTQTPVENISYCGQHREEEMAYISSASIPPRGSVVEFSRWNRSAVSPWPWERF